MSLHYFLLLSVFFLLLHFLRIFFTGDAMSDFSPSFLVLSTARQTLRPYAPQSSCLESKGADVDPLPDVSTCCQIKRWICSLIQCTLVDFVQFHEFENQVVQYSTNFMRSFYVSSVFTMTWMTRIALVRIVSKTKKRKQCSFFLVGWTWCSWWLWLGSSRTCSPRVAGRRCLHHGSGLLETGECQVRPQGDGNPGTGQRAFDTSQSPRVQAGCGRGEHDCTNTIYESWLPSERVPGKERVFSSPVTCVVNNWQSPTIKLQDFTDAKCCRCNVTSDSQRPSPKYREQSTLPLWFLHFRITTHRRLFQVLCHKEWITV